MTGLAVRVYDPTVFIAYGMPCCLGEIQIGEFKEKFYMPLEWWTIDDYQRQWREGLERIKTHDISCLVTGIQDPTKEPRVVFWPLYKEGDKVFIQNHFLFGEEFKKELKGKPFTLETCYDFVTPRETMSDDGTQPVSEWEVDLKDI